MSDTTIGKACNNYFHPQLLWKKGATGKIKALGIVASYLTVFIPIIMKGIQYTDELKFKSNAKKITKKSPLDQKVDTEGNKRLTPPPTPPRRPTDPTKPQISIPTPPPPPPAEPQKPAVDPNARDDQGGASDTERNSGGKKEPEKEPERKIDASLTGQSPAEPPVQQAIQPTVPQHPPIDPNARGGQGAADADSGAPDGKKEPEKEADQGLNQSFVGQPPERKQAAQKVLPLFSSDELNIPKPIEKKVEPHSPPSPPKAEIPEPRETILPKASEEPAAVPAPTVRQPTPPPALPPRRRINESTFKTLTKNTAELRKTIALLPEGVFKTNMDALINVVDPIITLDSSNLDDIKELTFAEFEAKIKADPAAREGFHEYDDLLKIPPETSLLVRYAEASNAVRKAITDLKNPLGRLSNTVNPPSPAEMLAIVTLINTTFKNLSALKIDELPNLRSLLINDLDYNKPFFVLKQAFADKTYPAHSLLMSEAINHMKDHLRIVEKNNLTFALELGREVINNPLKSFNSYLSIEGVVQFTKPAPSDSSRVVIYLQDVSANLDAKNDFTPRELIDLEAFATNALYTYITNPDQSIDANFTEIINLLNTIRTKTSTKMDDVIDKVQLVRREDQIQIFYRLMKDQIENTSNYPKTFWLNSSYEKMKFNEQLLFFIGSKIAEPNKALPDGITNVKTSKHLNYQICFQDAKSTKEKPKLLLFVNPPVSYAVSQAMNHQIGLYGDSTILEHAQNLISDILTTDTLKDYQDQLLRGDIEIVASGFDNAGTASTIVASHIAKLYPNTQVTSIAAGSIPAITTEDAYNMGKAENFYPIKLKSPQDMKAERLVDKLPGGLSPDYSTDMYNTFPIFISNVIESRGDLSKHNPEEYGNAGNFTKAMTHPLLLRNVYEKTASQILHTKLTKVSNKSLDLTIPYQLQEGSLSDLISLGKQILQNPRAYDQSFLKLDQRQITLEQKADQLLALKDENEQLHELHKSALEKAKNEGSWFVNPFKVLTDWLTSSPETKVVHTQVLKTEELVQTIAILQQVIKNLKAPQVRSHMSAEQAFHLLFAANTLLMNYRSINSSVGKMPELVDLIAEMKSEALNRLKELSMDGQQHKIIQTLINDNKANLGTLADRLKIIDPHFQELFNDKDVLGKIDFEDRFLEFLGFKTALKDQDKVGSSSYVVPLHKDPKNEYEISMYTPPDLSKKQRIVITCNGPDKLGDINLHNSELFTNGDKTVLTRSKSLSEIIAPQLLAQFTDLGIQPSDVEIVVTGFGVEGAVATLLGSRLAKRFEQGEVRSVAFGSPRFLAVGAGSAKIKEQSNFIPIRFLSNDDTRVELEFNPGLTKHSQLDANSYYTIPFQFRIVAALELGGHNTNLYGDVQAIKTAMKNAYQMREIYREGKQLTALLDGDVPAPAPIKKTAGHVVVDDRKALLENYAKCTDEQLKLIEPGKIIRVMKYCVELSENDPITNESKQLISAFFEKFSRAIKNEDINEDNAIKNSFFQKMINSGYEPNRLFGGKWSLQRIISPKLAEAMDKVAQADANLPLKAKNELILILNYERGVLFGNLNGNRYQPAGGGVNGAVFFRCLESGLMGQIYLLPHETFYRPFLGVFKPHPETVRDAASIFNFAQLIERGKGFVGMDSYLNKGDQDCRVRNESFAYELFHIFGFDAPDLKFPTTLLFENPMDPKKRLASFCDFIPGYQTVDKYVFSEDGDPAKKISNLLDDKRSYTQEELDIWQRSKLGDWATQNMDGHGGNAFVKVENGRVVGAVNFDYDKAFPISKTPHIRNQYKWAELEISKHDITPATRAFLQRILVDVDSKIDQFLAKAREKGKEHFTAKQEEFLRERVAILIRISKGDSEYKMLSDLSKYKKA